MIVKTDGSFAALTSSPHNPPIVPAALTTEHVSHRVSAVHNVHIIARDWRRLHFCTISKAIIFHLYYFHFTP